MSKTIHVDPSKIEYFTSTGVDGDDFVNIISQKRIESIDMSRLEYQPAAVHDLEGALQFYRATYPKLQEPLLMVLARCAIGKPMNRADRRNYARELKKELKKS